MSDTALCLDFTDKVAVVTGGAMGIGKAVAQGIIAGGGQVVIADINLEAANETCAQLGENATAVKLDLGKTHEIGEVFSGVLQEKKRVDILVNCAGVISTAPFEQITLEEWEKVVSINLTGAFAAISAVFPSMKENGYGKIVNVSSVAAKVGGGLLGTAAYASSKAGLNGLTKAVAREGGPHGIYCNAVCPSYTVTQMTSALTDDSDRADAVKQTIPLRKSAQPKEIANMILFFASDLASFITGEIGDADGGLTRDG